MAMGHQRSAFGAALTHQSMYMKFMPPWEYKKTLGIIGVQTGTQCDDSIIHQKWGYRNTRLRNHTPHTRLGDSTQLRTDWEFHRILYNTVYIHTHTHIYIYMYIYIYTYIYIYIHM